MTVMPASPGDIAKYTTDGVVITSEDPALKVTHPDAVDLGSEEKEMFFVSSAHAQILLDETLELRSKANACHVGVEVDETLGVGTHTAIAPGVPCSRSINEADYINALSP